VGAATGMTFVRRAVVPASLLLLVLLALTSGRWLPSLLDFVRANASLIQGLDSLLQLVIAALLVTLFLLLVRFRTSVLDRVIPRQLPAEARSEPKPHQLPPDIHDFVDRDDQLAELKRLLKRRRAADSPVPIYVLGGSPGVGKTALAVRAAHRLKRRYPDGQLYAKLRTPKGESVDPADVLAGFLRSLNGEEAVVPTAAHEREAAYRDRLSGRRILVLLDDAANLAQVRPLLPGSGTCAVLVTSQSPLTGLPSTRQKLHVLEPEHAVELLSKVAGHKRIVTEPVEANRIVERCGRLPLAVRIAGAKLDANPEWRLATLAGRLDEHRRSLLAMSAGDLEVRASLLLSYQGRSETEQTAFRLLAIVKAPSFPSWAAAVLLDVPPYKADDVLEGLCEAQLLEGIGEDGIGQLRYRFHNLVYLLAEERLEQDEPQAAQQRARARLLDAYLHLAEEASARLQPGRPDPPTGATVVRARVPANTIQAVQRDALGWFGAERGGLIAAVRVAHEAGEWHRCARLVDAMTAFFELRSSWDDWSQVSSLAIEAARNAKDLRLEAQALRNDGDLQRERRNWPAATARFRRCLVLYRRLGDRAGEACTMRSIGSLYRDQGHWRRALRWYRRSVPIFEEFEDGRGRSLVLHDIGVALRNNGEWMTAIGYFQESQRAFHDMGERRGEASTWRGIGVAHRNLGQWDSALECFDKALEIFREISDRRGIARTLANRADVYQERGEWAKAIDDLDACMKLHQELSDRLLQGDTLRRQSVCYRKRGDPHKALALLNDARCLPLFIELGEHRWMNYALHNQGEAYLALGRPEEARDLFEACLPYFQLQHDRLWEAKSLQALGIVLVRGSREDSHGGRERLQSAVRIFQDLGAPEAAEVTELLTRVT
jgi:tetratricopeptide (TPR) repeat protein